MRRTLLMIQNNGFTSLTTNDQSASPSFTCTFDRLIKSFGVNLILTILFTYYFIHYLSYRIEF